MNRNRVILLLASLFCSILLLLWGLDLKEEASELTEYQLSMSAPGDILGLGYWAFWSIVLIFQFVLLLFAFPTRENWSRKYFGIMFICAVAFATATISSYDNYAVLEQRVLG